MTEKPEDDKPYTWIVKFKEGEDERAYLYTKRSIKYMMGKLSQALADNGQYPFRVWVLVEDEMRRVDIS